MSTCEIIDSLPLSDSLCEMYAAAFRWQRDLWLDWCCYRDDVRYTHQVAANRYLWALPTEHLVR